MSIDKAIVKVKILLPNFLTIKEYDATLSSKIKRGYLYGIHEILRNALPYKTRS